MSGWRRGDVRPQILETLTRNVEAFADRKMVATILLMGSDGLHLHAGAGASAPRAWSDFIEGMEIGENAGSCGTAAFRRERVIVTDISTDPLWAAFKTEALKHGFRACWSTPVNSSDGKVLGTFAVYYFEPTAPTPQEIQIVDIATRTAAIAIERKQSEQALRESQTKLEQHAKTLEQSVLERTAKLQETIAELESFSYSISHDLRAPLRAMQSFASLLGDEYVNEIGEDGKDYIRRIVTSAARMDRLIQDILMFSRIARTDLRLQPVDVDALLRGILESYPHFDSSKADIQISGTLPVVLGNEAALTQCISNLIGNAVKFVPLGVKPVINIWATREGRVRIFFGDNGIGIPSYAHVRIFGIFQQLNRTYEGTGIGLAIVRKAVERMQDSIGLKSQPENGSTFWLELNPAKLS
ncbi:MAG: ATP-binding protein [Verrucomicrobiota bacterium]